MITLLSSVALWSCVDRTRASLASSSRPSQGSTSRPARQKPARQSPEPGADKGSIEIAREAFIPDTGEFSKLLGKIVRRGGVDYAVLKQDSKVLDQYLAGVAKVNLKKADKKAKLVFYINAYNATVLRMVLDNIIGKGSRGANIKGVLELKGKPGFFDREDALVGGKRMSLNALEGLGRALGDPRIHFAVNCASASCPVLEDSAWTIQGLEQGLSAATRKYFLSEYGLQIIDGKLHVTQVLNWYAKDFGGAKGAVSFLRTYAPPAARSLLDDGIAGYLDYDWSLNSR